MSMGKDQGVTASLSRAVSETTHEEFNGVKSYILDDGSVKITATQFQEAFGLHRGGTISSRTHGAELPRFLARKSIKPFLSDSLTTWLKEPVKFVLPQGGAVAFGYDVDLLVDVAEVVVDAWRADALRADQIKMARSAAQLLRSLARLGVKTYFYAKHGRAMDPDAVMRTLRQQLQAEQQSRAEIEKSLAVQVRGAEMMSTRLHDLEVQLRVVTSGAVKDVPRVHRWIMSTINDIAMLRMFSTKDLTEAQAKGAVQEELRRSLGFHHLPLEQFPYGRMDDMRTWLFWLHRDAKKGAKRAGFGGCGAWTQPPLPLAPPALVGSDDDDDDGEED